jgi:uncharacterized DUF497 family protein
VFEFDWDDANLKHLKRHRVRPEEFEQAILDAVDLDYEDVGGEDRYHAVGATGSGRLLYMVWTPREGKIRAVTAFTAGRASIREWRQRRI